MIKKKPAAFKLAFNASQLDANWTSLAVFNDWYATLKRCQNLRTFCSHDESGETDPDVAGEQLTALRKKKSSFAFKETLLQKNHGLITVWLRM